MVATVGTGLLGFILIPFLVLNLGLVEFGLLGMAYVFAATGYASLFELGFQGSISRSIAEYNAKGEIEKIRSLTFSSLIIFFGLGLILFSIGTVCSEFIVTTIFKVSSEQEEILIHCLYLMFSSYLFMFPIFALSGIYAGFQKFNILKGLEFASYLIFFMLSIFWVFDGRSIFYVVLALFISKLALFLGYFLFLPSVIPGLKIKNVHFSTEIIKENWSVAKYVFMRRGSETVFLQTPGLLISIFLGPAFMAMYDIIAKLPRFIKVFIGLSNAAVMPAASELHATEDNEKLKSLFLHGFKLQTAFMIPIIAAAVWFSEEFLHVWVGEEFRSLAPVMQLMLIWTLLSMLVNYGGGILLGAKWKLKETTRLALITSALSVMLSLILINKYELYGVVGGMVTSVLITVPFFLIIYVKKFTLTISDVLIPYFKVLLVSVIPIAIFAIAGKSFSANNLLTLFVSGAIYCLLYWVAIYLTVLDSVEKRHIKSVYKQLRT